MNMFTEYDLQDDPDELVSRLCKSLGHEDIDKLTTNEKLEIVKDKLYMGEVSLDQIKAVMDSVEE